MIKYLYIYLDGYCSGDHFDDQDSYAEAYAFARLVAEFDDKGTMVRGSLKLEVL